MIVENSKSALAGLPTVRSLRSGVVEILVCVLAEHKHTSKIVADSAISSKKNALSKDTFQSDLRANPLKLFCWDDLF